jgi:glycosyltransferase involved in cell wall biosynthesis
MFSSTIIPTVDRPTLTRAVQSVLEQSVSDLSFEVIVVNDSGRPLTPASWMQSKRVTVLETQHRERSVARNAGAAIAQGRYLHFLDDDDWLAPGAISAWRALAERTEAGWLYGGAQLVNRVGKPLVCLTADLAGNCFAQAMAGEWLPLQASLIGAEVFFGLGGYNPLITGPEDIDLWRRFARLGDVAGTSEIVAYISWGNEGSTTPYAWHAEYSQEARERILAMSGVFERLWASARSEFWQARVARCYLTSVVWNVRRGRWLTAASRAAFGTRALVQTGWPLVSPSYWRSVTTRYQSPTFQKSRRSKATNRPGLL